MFPSEDIVKDLDSGISGKEGIELFFSRLVRSDSDLVNKTVEIPLLEIKLASVVPQLVAPIIVTNTFIDPQ